MAPRKRTTKQRKDNPRVAKLEAFLDDFDSEVKTRADQLMERFNQLLKDVDHRYHVALIKLPESIRQTTWLDHFKSEKQKSPVVNNVKKEEEAAIVDSIEAIDHAVLLKSAKKMRKGGAKSTSEDENTPSTTRKGKVTKKPRTTTKKSKALSVSQQNSTIRRSNRRPLATPANSIREFSVLMGSTPLVTPRFDPRLPKTPAVRVPRHKERVYSISVNGSPIAAGNEDIVINVPIGNGESIQLLASQMDSVDLSMLDEAAVRRIRQLQNRLTSLCGV